MESAARTMTQLSEQEENRFRVIAVLVGAGIGLVLGLVFGNMFTLALLGAIGAFFADSLLRDLDGPANGGLLDAIRPHFRNPSPSMVWSRHLPLFVLATLFFMGWGSLVMGYFGYLPGAKERAFHKLLAEYENVPDDFAPDWKRERHRDRLEVLQRNFEAIKFDAASNRDPAIRMIKLWQRRIERRFSGHMAQDLETMMTSMYESVRRGKE
jgi:hypothetical protein